MPLLLLVSFNNLLLWLSLIVDGTLGLVSRQTKFLIRQQLQLPVQLGFFGNALSIARSSIDNNDSDTAEKQKQNDVVPDVKVLLQRQPTVVILLSLQHPEFTGRFSKTVADLWKWKDAVLGDGRDYFIPRPKTLAALQRYLISQVELIHTIVVLSNCARLELLLIIRPSQQETTSTQHIDGDNHHCASLSEAISRALLLQVHDFQCQRLFGPPPIDWPSAIAMNPVTEQTTTEMMNEQVKELAQHWKTYDTMQSVLTHWCQVAAGLAGRPNRPDRNVAFRPFSSRDAHIMLQLKRLVLMDAGAENRMVSKWIVDTALSAGKAARSNAIVQTHRPFLLDSTQGMPLTIAQQVQDEILEPLVQRALSQWYTNSASGVIQMIRRQALELANTDEERQWIQRTQLHNVTMVLRQEHQTFDTESFLTGLQQRLQAQRK